jgi:ubiquinone/menaquinone biosynthesis C-methylase UbiE
VHVVNLTKPADWNENLDQFTFEVGDGSALRFKDQEFDVAYSNSVIEHLGSWQKQVLFAREMTRVAKRVYVQTPAQEFFIEPHLLTPFIHWFPPEWQLRLTRNFTVWGIITRPSQEYVASFLKERKLLRRSEFRKLFPDCTIMDERIIGLTKSYIAMSVKNV